MTKPYPLMHTWLSYAASPPNLGRVVRLLEAIRPVLANTESFVRRLLGMGGDSDFTAALRDGTRLQFPPGNGVDILRSAIPTMIVETWAKRIYNPRDFEIRNGFTVVDIGANIGVFTLFAARQNTGGLTIACEPVPAAYDLLRRNLELNGIKNVHTHRTGVLDHTGKDTIWLHPTNFGANTIFRNRLQVPNPEATSVDFVPLETLLETEDTAEVDLLKLDCEGSEYRIFQACSDATLSRIRRVVFEYHTVPESPGALPRLVQRLTRVGYSVSEESLGPTYGLVWAIRR